MSQIQLPDGYFNRHDADDGLEEHLFVAGRGLQSAELNEIQQYPTARLRRISDAIFKDGDLVRGAGIGFNPDTGLCACDAGDIYVRGAVRSVTSASFVVPLTGFVSVGLYLLDSVITPDDDESLLDPAAGEMLYLEPGAARRKVQVRWGHDAEQAPAGDFYPVYAVENGVLMPKERPPAYESVVQSIARYDRDSAGSSYVVAGMECRMLADSGGLQQYSVAAGRCRVRGYGIEFAAASRVTAAIDPDLRQVDSEAHVSVSSGAQRINFDQTPANNLYHCVLTAERTVTITHGSFVGASDSLPDTSVVSIQSVVQGGTTYTQGTDYQLTSGDVNWSLAGAEPAPGSTYQCTYRYIKVVTPTAIDAYGCTVTGAVVGTTVLVSYNQCLPRYDRICVTDQGRFSYVKGVASSTFPIPPSVPSNLLVLATIFQTWDANRSVSNDGLRMVSMAEISAMGRRIDYILGLVAQQRLESSIHTREAGAKKSLFTDPFLDDTHRDAGQAQNGAVFDGFLVPPIEAEASFFGNGFEMLPGSGVVTLSQPIKTLCMKINPYLAFEVNIIPPSVTLTPAEDRWVEFDTQWLSPITRVFERFVSGATVGDVVRTDTQVATISTSDSNITLLRSIPISFSVSGFRPNEPVTSVTFDSVQVIAPGVLTASPVGSFAGEFSIPAGIPAGSKSVVFLGAFGSSGSAVFVGQGVLTTTTMQQTITTVVARPPLPAAPVDPLAQTFTYETDQQLWGVDLWLCALGTSDILVQIRETDLGIPSRVVLAESRLPVSACNTTGTTRFDFDIPLGIRAGIEYAIVVMCTDAVGACSVAKLGDYDTENRRFVTAQPYQVGALLSSSNASTWTPHNDMDLAFRLLSARYSASTRTVSLGSVDVAGATDLMVRATVDIFSASTYVKFALTLPDATVLLVDADQPIRLDEAITGTVALSAILYGDTEASPVLYPGVQLIHGTVANDAVYIGRAVLGGVGVKARVIIETLLTGSATLAVHVKGGDAGDVWVATTQIATQNFDDGWIEHTFESPVMTEQMIQVKVTLTGTPQHRPMARDLRMLVI